MYDLWLLQITMLRKVDINLCPTEIMGNVRTTLFTSLKTDKGIENIICVLLGCKVVPLLTSLIAYSDIIFYWRYLCICHT